MLDENMSKRLGNEKLTRPEEISALSKYLKHIKTVQEEHTKLDEDNLELFGKETGNIKEPSLVDYIDSLDSVEEVKELEKRKEKIEDIREVKLEDTVDTLEVDDNLNLDNTKDKMVGEIKTPALDTTSEILLGEIKKLTLSEFKEKINPEKPITLGEFKERLGEIKDIPLSDSLEKLGVDLVKLSLGKEKEMLNVSKEIELDKTKELLNAGENNIELSRVLELLGGVRSDIKLSDFIEALGGNMKNLTLSMWQAIIPGFVEDLELEKESEKLLSSKTKSPDGLETESENLSFGRFIKPELEKDKEILRNTDIVDHLEDCSEELKELIRMVEDARRIKTTSELYEKAMELLEYNGQEWSDRIAESFSRKLSNENRLDNEDILEFGEELNKVFEGLRIALDGSIIDDKEKEVNNRFNEGEDSVYWQRDKHISQRVPNTKLPDWTRWGKSSADVLGDIAKYTGEESGKYNVSTYVRFLAEQAINQKITNGQTRRYLIEETMAALVVGRYWLEKQLEVNRDRLPGKKNLSEFIGNLINSSGVNLSSSVRSLIGTSFDKLNDVIFNRDNASPNRPVHVPTKETVTGDSEAEVTREIGLPEEALAKFTVEHGVSQGPITLESVSRENDNVDYKNRDSRLLPGITKSGDGSITDDKFQNLPHNKKSRDGVIGRDKDGNEVFDNLNTINTSNRYYSFRDNYLYGQGIATTLSELCSTNVDSIRTVNDLYDSLKNGEYITTPGKFNSIGKNGDFYTLDNNAYWEIVMEPYAGEENGYFSYLPSFREMDVINKVVNGVTTCHKKWIPFTGFELSKSRLTTKSLGLFDGEIAYPIASEFTNELRLTIADDSYKSWRWYFQKCLDISVYNSEPHSCEFYKQDNPKLTVVDKTTHLVAFYKNITFLVGVYILTPQYSTIKKYNLLCVLRELSEEFSGEIDPGGSSDISLSFSIVGELGTAIKSKPLSKKSTNVREWKNSKNPFVSGGSKIWESNEALIQSKVQQIIGKSTNK